MAVMSIQFLFFIILYASITVWDREGSEEFTCTAVYVESIQKRGRLQVDL